MSGREDGHIEEYIRYATGQQGELDDLEDWAFDNKKKINSKKSRRKKTERDEDDYS